MCVSLIDGKYFMVILFLKPLLSNFFSINSQANTACASIMYLHQRNKCQRARYADLWKIEEASELNIYTKTKDCMIQQMASKAKPTPANSTQPKLFSLQILTIATTQKENICSTDLQADKMQVKSGKRRRGKEVSWHIFITSIILSLAYWSQYINLKQTCSINRFIYTAVCSNPILYIEWIFILMVDFYATQKIILYVFSFGVNGCYGISMLQYFIYA